MGEVGRAKETVEERVGGGAMITETWPYGTTRRAKVIENESRFTIVEDDTGKVHILAFGAGDRTAKKDEQGTLTFTFGGPTGGYWKFTKDAANEA